MANDLITRLLLDSKQFDNNITKATREVQDFQKKTAGISKTVSNSFNSMLGVVGKIAPALGVAVGGYEAFNKVVNSSEGNIDAWGRTCEAAKASVDSFFISLNTGNFSNFLSGLGEVIKSAREAYDAIDDLGTTIAFQDVELSKLETKKLQLEIQIKEGKGGQEELEEVNDQIYALAGERAAKAEAAYKASLKSVIQSETGGWYDAEMADYWSTWENFKTLSKADLARENQELEKRKQALGSQYDLVLANYNKYKKMVESGTASEKVAQSVALVDATREYNVKKAILDQETKILEAKQYQVTAQKALQSAYQSEKETLRYTADKTEKQAKSVSDMARSANAFKNALSGGEVSFTINGKNLFNDSNIVNAIKTMSNEDIIAFNKLTKTYENKNNQLNTLVRENLVTVEDFQREKETNDKALVSGLLSLSNGGILNQNAKMANEVILPILKNIDSNSKAGSNPVQATFDAYSASISENSQKLANNPPKNVQEAQSWKEGLQQFKQNIQNYANDYNLNAAKGLSSMFSDLADFDPETYQGAKELTDQFLEGKYTLQEYATLIEGLGLENIHLNLIPEDQVEQFGLLANELDPLINKLDGIQNKMEQVENTKMQLANMSQLISSFHSFGDSGISAFANILQAIIPVISAFGALAVAEGAEKGVKTSKNWIEAVAAVVTLVGTISAAIAAGRNKSKYANGGIVQGGSYSGDTGTVRVNAGEMILNGSQQANLFRLLNDGGFNNSAMDGQVEFKIRGQELVGILNNYNRKTSRVL